MPRMPSLTAILALTMLLTLSACTRVVTVRTQAEDLPAGSVDAAGDGDAWWSIAFTLRWDQEQEPDWHLDALLADQVCAPALAELRSHVRLWRFHRRSGYDKVGHRFSLRVYTDELMAESLYGRVRESSVLNAYARIQLPVLIGQYSRRNSHREASRRGFSIPYP